MDISILFELLDIEAQVDAAIAEPDRWERANQVIKAYQRIRDFRLKAKGASEQKFVEAAVNRIAEKVLRDALQ